MQWQSFVFCVMTHVFGREGIVYVLDARETHQFATSFLPVDRRAAVKHWPLPAPIFFCACSCMSLNADPAETVSRRCTQTPCHADSAKQTAGSLCVRCMHQQAFYDCINYPSQLSSSCCAAL